MNASEGVRVSVSAPADARLIKHWNNDMAESTRAGNSVPSNASLSMGVMSPGLGYTEAVKIIDFTADFAVLKIYTSFMNGNVLPVINGDNCTLCYNCPNTKGDIIMATSSIFKNFTIEGPVEVANFVKMLDSEPMPVPECRYVEITDTEEAWKLLKAGIESMKELKEKKERAAAE